MQKLMLTWEIGKGYTLTIDGLAFEKLTKTFIIEGCGCGAPNVSLELSGNNALLPKQTKNE